MGVAQPAGVQGGSGPRVDRGVPRLLDGEPVGSAPQLAAHQVGAPLGGVQLGEGQGSLEPERERMPRGGPRVAPGGARASSTRPTQCVGLGSEHRGLGPDRAGPGGPVREGRQRLVR